MSLEKETARAASVLGRGLLAHLSTVVWWSACLTALLSLAAYFSRPETFEASDAWFTFVALFVTFAAVTFFGLLLAAGRHRKRPGAE